MKPNRHRPPGPSSRDLGLVNSDAGKGSAPRNLSEKFRTNFDEIDFYKDFDWSENGFEQVGHSKFIKKYK